jgi:hypothetical protein
MGWWHWWMMSMINGMTLPYVIPPSGIQHLHMPRMPQTALDMGVRMGVVDMDATLSDQWHSPHFIKPNLMYPRNSYLAHQETMQIQQRCNVEQLGMVHQSSSEGNMEVKNYGVNEYGDHYLSGLREA